MRDVLSTLAIISVLTLVLGGVLFLVTVLMQTSLW